MASTKGFEPLTVRLEGGCSIQLSYVDNLLTYNITIICKMQPSEFTKFNILFCLYQLVKSNFFTQKSFSI